MLMMSTNSASPPSSASGAMKITIASSLPLKSIALRTSKRTRRPHPRRIHLPVAQDEPHGDDEHRAQARKLIFVEIADSPVEMSYVSYYYFKLSRASTTVESASHYFGVRRSMEGGGLRSPPKKTD